ncbi:MAG: hypothetical protein JNM51_06330 [Bacteroidia bacterium]|nr:hypothetical protein [Bacteroidia bacterium]
MNIKSHHKVTHEDYVLHEVEALEGRETFDSGANKPLLIRGIIKQTGEKGDFLVKFNAAERMNPTACCFEYIGACMAKELGLLPAEPVIIEITQDFVDQSVGKDWWGMANKSKGDNYGCYFVEGGRNFPKGEPLSAQQYREAQNIFAFDVFLINPDRRDEKQNMITDGKNILIFDHELAFGFIFELFNNNSTPWIISEVDKNWVKKHYFYPYLKGNDVEFGSFVDKFVNLDARFWSKIEENIPDIWKVEHIKTIRNRTEEFIKNKDLFTEELKKIVA